jgi:predicted MFS family arabinose efflux permease
MCAYRPRSSLRPDRLPARSVPADPAGTCFTGPRRGRRRIRRKLSWGILAVAVAVGVARFALTPIAPLMRQAGVLPVDRTTSLLASANYVGNLVGTLLCAFVISPRHRPRALRLSLIVIFIATAAMSCTTDLSIWLLLRALCGLAGAIVFVVASGTVLPALDELGYKAASARLYSGIGLGIAMTALVVMPVHHWRIAWLVLGLLALVLAIRVGRRSSMPRGRAAAQTQARTPLLAPGTAMWLLFAATFLQGLGYIVTATFLPTIMQHPAGLGAQAWLVTGLAAVPSTAVWGRVSARFGTTRALLAAYLLQAVGIALPVVAATAAADLVSAALFGSTFVGIVAMLFHCGCRLLPDRSAWAVATLAACYGAGQALGPFFAEAGMRPALGLGTAAILAGTIPLTLLHRLTRSRDREPEHPVAEVLTLDRVPVRV